VSGFQFHETMSGSYRLLAEGDGAAERPLSFTLHAESGPLLRFLRDPLATVTGTLSAPGLASSSPVRGTLGLYLATRQTLEYHLEFTGDDGGLLVFDGKKTVRLSTLPESMTVLPGRILRVSGEPVAEALVRFDLRGDLVRFLMSFKRAP
jgi:hypothetical protein